VDRGRKEYLSLMYSTGVYHFIQEVSVIRLSLSIQKKQDRSAYTLASRFVRETLNTLLRYHFFF